MPRQPRLQFEGAFYHVYHRGNRKQLIFLDDQDCARFESMLFEAMNRSGVFLYSWKLMPNHFHLLVETPDGNLAEFMQRLLTRYAMYFNWRHQQVGHLFQGRYGSKVCDKDAYFKELVRYIQLNAYRTSRPLAETGEWKWSSHRYLMMSEKQWPDGLRGAFQEVLSQFAKDPWDARRFYAQFLADGLKNGSWKSFYKSKEERFLGNEAFIEKVKRCIGEKVRQSPRQLKYLQNAKALLEIVAKISTLSLHALSASGQKEIISRWRQAFVYVGRRRYRWSVKSLAHVMGRKENAASQMLRRMRRPEEHVEVRQLLKALEQ